MANLNKSSNDEDTDSLEIKPPQMISRYDKQKKTSSSSSRDKKHSRNEHRHKDRERERNDRPRQHQSNQSSGRHHPNFDAYDQKYSLSSRDSSQKRLVSTKNSEHIHFTKKMFYFMFMLNCL